MFHIFCNCKRGHGQKEVSKSKRPIVGKATAVPTKVVQPTREELKEETDSILRATFGAFFDRHGVENEELLEEIVQWTDRIILETGLRIIEELKKRD